MSLRGSPIEQTASLPDGREIRVWVGVPQDLLNAVIGRASHDRVNLETEKLIRGAGVEVLSSERWLLGAMTLIVGRAP